MSGAPQPPDAPPAARAQPGAAPPEPWHARLRHWAGFVVSGSLAFLVDASVLTGLTLGFGVDPFSARLLAIAVATVAAWLLHRTLTFPMRVAPSIAEFTKFATLATSSNALNYALYSLILLVRREIMPVAALAMATAVAMCASYLGMRFGVFRGVEPHDRNPR